MYDNYTGHPTQCYGVEEHRLVGGKGDGMRLFEVRNGKGLEFTIAADRAGDISRLTFGGYNFGFFSPCGYVAPQFYDKTRTGFPKSFTAGFLTTCGLNAVGAWAEDGEELPFHGTISNTPADQIYYTIDQNAIRIHAVVRDAQIFGRKLILKREISCLLTENEIQITDTVENAGDTISPLMILYHFNMGYPLLDESSLLYISSDQVTPYNERALEGIDEWGKAIPPQKCFEEQCYFHHIDGLGGAAMFQPAFEKGVAILFNTDELDCFTQWKMMGCSDYVMGFEPGNCLPSSREKMLEQGILKYIEPGDSKKFHVTIKMIDGWEQWKQATFHSDHSEI